MGNFYIQTEDGSMEKIFSGELQTIEFEPEPLDIMNESKNVFCNLMPEQTITFKVEPCCITKDIIKPKVTDPWTISQYDHIQKRKHHKTRINKKWAKKYGYWTVEDTYEILNLKPDNLDKEVVTYDGEMKFRERRIY